MIDARTRAPISDALVRLVSIPRWWTGRPTRRIGEERATVTTDAHGVARFDRSKTPSDEPRRALFFASAAGRVEVFVDSVPKDGATRIEIALSPGMRISGFVIDEARRPVPGIDLVAVDVAGAPRALPPTGTGAGPFEPTASVDAGGRFVVEGLAEGRMYDLLPATDGWALLRTPSVRPGPIPSRAIPAGREGVEVQVVRVRAYRVRCLDDTTGRPFTQHTFELPADGTGAIRGWWESGSHHSPIASGRGRAHPGAHTFLDLSAGVRQGWMTLSSEAALSRQTVLLYFEPVGYKPRTAEVRLLRPSEVEAATPDEVRLVRKVPVPRGSLRITERARSTDCYRTPSRFVQLEYAGGTEYFWAAPIEGGWVVADLPAGSARVAVNDGVGSSHKVDSVEIVEGREARIEATYPAATGIALEMVSDEGETIYDAEMVIPESLSGRKSGAVAAWKFTALQLDARGMPAPVFCQLTPDTYRVRVRKVGFEEGSEQVEVPEGKTVRVRVRLRPLGGS